MSDIIEKLLRKSGPLLAGDLAKQLEKRGLSPSNARKLIQRASGEVVRLQGIRFVRNERFVYLRDHYGSGIFWERLLKAFEARSSVYAFTINGLLARRGIIPSSQFNAVCSAPSKMKGQVPASIVLRHLTKIELVQPIEYKDLGECLVLNSAIEETPRKNSLPMVRARLLAEGILLNALRDWLKKLGLGSYNQIKLRNGDGAPSFGQFFFDLTAPSYIPPLASFSDGQSIKPGFIVCDVVLDAVLTTRQIAGFIRKVSTLRQQRRLRPFLAMLVADGFDSEAFSTLKRQGIIATNPSTLFGETVGKALRTLLSTLSSTAAVAANPENLSGLFQDLSAIEGAANNLRGPLFELVVAHLARRTSQYVELRKQFTDIENGNRAEVDVYGISTDAVTLCECRGYVSSPIPLEDVEKWVTQTLPTARNYLLGSDHRNKKLHGEFWTTSTFAPDAEAYLRERQSSLKKYRIDWFDGAGVRKLLTERQEIQLRTVLDEHFFKNPLSKASRRKQS